LAWTWKCSEDGKSEDCWTNIPICTFNCEGIGSNFIDFGVEPYASTKLD
jgi:hypothetical protein